jgi:hypothetical protein
VLAGIMALGVSANAFVPFDTHITIDRALNSPTLTIRYTGAHAALVELRVNGDSLGTRSMSSVKDAGETNFNISLTDLKDGDNEVEVRLFDRTGKLVGTDKTNISTDQADRGPVFLASPKVGATVRGPVEIKLSFSRDIKNSIASFFVDNNFKAMSNYPPYSYIWDTTRETNGWHEVEAWDVDESSQTLKTKKTRVFVDNPGGRTERNGAQPDLKMSNPGFKGSIEGGDANVKENTSTSKSNGSFKPAGVAPKVSGSTISNQIHVTPVTGASDIQPAPKGTTIAMGPRNLTPTAHRNAVVASTKPTGTINISVHSNTTTPSKTSPATVAMNSTKQSVPTGVVNAVNSAAHMLSITRGQRVPNIGTFAIELNSQFVKFDVQPRVDDGVPMTPLRYLLEKDGGKVNWENMTKTVRASADGKSIVIQIGDRNAKVDQVTVSMEVTPYLDRGRTIVPLSFIHDALGVNVEYDKETGHVLITSAAK